MFCLASFMLLVSNALFKIRLHFFKSMINSVYMIMSLEIEKRRENDTNLKNGQVLQYEKNVIGNLKLKPTHKEFVEEHTGY